MNTNNENAGSGASIDVENQLKGLKGTFVESLRRNYKQIRDDRALKIAKTAQTLFKRKVEDLANNIDDLKMDRDNLLDLNGTSTTAIISASDFNADDFVIDIMSKYGIDFGVGTKVKVK